MMPHSLKITWIGAMAAVDKGSKAPAFTITMGVAYIGLAAQFVPPPGTCNNICVLSHKKFMTVFKLAKDST
jgi:hypothetical protein